MTIEDYMNGIKQGVRIVRTNIMEQQDVLEAEYQRRRPSYGLSNEKEGDRYCRVDVLLDFIDKMNLQIQGAQRMSVINDVMNGMFPELKVEYEAMKWGKALHADSVRLLGIANAASERTRK